MVPGSGDDADGEAPYVRPYTVTGGRTRPSSQHLPIEALVQAVGAPHPGLTAEKRQILELSSVQFLSVAELSAHVRQPVGVVRVLVSDLVDANLVRVHGLAMTESAYTPATTLSVLESVLNGISAL
jgi:hypothetical protein